MKKKTIIYAMQALLLAAPTLLGAQGLTDNFSTNAWTQNITGASPVVGGGVMNFATATTGIRCAAMNYSHRSLGFTLNSADSWTAEFEFSPTNASNTSNTNTYSPAHTLLSLSAGTANSWNTTSGGGISNIDDVEVYYNCTLNANSNSWQIFGRSKDGTTWNTASTGITLDAVTTTFTTFYIRLQRISPTQGIVSVFTDATFTTHLAGSPACFPIASTVTGLTHAQMGAIPQGGNIRYLTATIDNLNIYNNSLCLDYASNAGWNQTGSLVSIPGAGPNCAFSGCPGNSDHSEERDLGGLIQNSRQWYAETQFVPTTISSIGPGHGILCLAAGTAGNIWDFSPVNNQDVVAAYLSSTQYSGSAGWMMYGVAKDGTTWSAPSTGIHIPALNRNYFVVLERISATCGRLSVYSDAAHQNQLAGSPQDFTIPAGVTGLNTLSHTSMKQAGGSRNLTATVDNTCIINYFESGGVISMDQTICLGSAPDTLESNADASHVGCGGSGTYQWEMESPCGSGFWSQISGATSPDYLPASPTVTTCYRRAATVPNGCTNVTMYSNTITITVNPAPTVDPGPGAYLCCGPVYTMGGSPTASGGASPYTYNWNPSVHLSCTNCANPTTDICQWTNGEQNSYTITVTDANGCTAWTKVEIRRSLTCREGNPNDPEADLISIYPNPSDGMITVNIPESKIGETMSIYDLTGRMVYTENLSGQQSKINLSMYETGVYFIHIGSGENEFIQKIEIQH